MLNSCPKHLSFCLSFILTLPRLWLPEKHNPSVVKRGPSRLGTMRKYLKRESCKFV